MNNSQFSRNHVYISQNLMHLYLIECKNAIVIVQRYCSITLFKHYLIIFAKLFDVFILRTFFAVQVLLQFIQTINEFQNFSLQLCVIKLIWSNPKYFSCTDVFSFKSKMTYCMCTKTLNKLASNFIVSCHFRLTVKDNIWQRVFFTKNNDYCR